MRSKLDRKLHVEALESRTLLSTISLETEPNNRRPTADEIAFDPSDGKADVIGTTASRSDPDFYHFKAATDGSVDLRFESTKVAGRVTVLDRSGRKLFETAPNQGINSGGFTVRAGRDVFLLVSNEKGSRGGYAVHLTQHTADSVLVETEPNDNKRGANKVDLGSDGILRLQGISWGQRDNDFYSLTPSVRGTLSVAVQSARAKLDVADSQGHKLFETKPNDGVNSGLIQLAPGTSYFIRLRSPDSRPAAYLADLVLVASEASDNASEPPNVLVETEPNDNQATAQVIDLGSDGTLRVQGISSNQDDKDFFVLTPSMSGSLSIAVNGTADPRAQLEVEDNQGTTLFETEPNDGVDSGAIQVVAGTTYQIRLRSPDTRPAAYVVELGLTANPDSAGSGADGGEPANVLVETEPNDDPASANAIDLGSDGMLQLQGTSSNQDDNDIFAFTPTVSGPLSVNVQSADGPVAKLEVEESPGIPLFETEPNDGLNSGSFEVTAGKTYFIRLRSPDNLSAAYLVDLALTSNESSGSGGGGGQGSGGGSEPGNVLVEAEPNDDHATANPMDLGSDGILQLQGTSASQDDKDFFVFTPAMSGTLSIKVQSVDGRMAKLEVEDNQGIQLFETEPKDGVNSGSLSLTAGSTYFMRLRSPDTRSAAYLVDLALAGV